MQGQCYLDDAMEPDPVLPPGECSTTRVAVDDSAKGVPPKSKSLRSSVTNALGWVPDNPAADTTERIFIWEWERTKDDKKCQKVKAAQAKIGRGVWRQCNYDDNGKLPRDTEGKLAVEPIEIQGDPEFADIVVVGYDVDDISKITPQEKLKLCRRASKLHFDLILAPTRIAKRLKPELEDFYKCHNMKQWQRFWVAFFSVVVAFLPNAYANLVIGNTCIAIPHTLGWKTRVSGPASETITLSREDCDLEQRLQSTEGLWWGACVVVGSFALLVIMAWITSLLQFCAGMAKRRRSTRFNEATWLNLKRLLWRPLLLLWYFWIGRRMPSLKYANEDSLIPGLYTPVSLLCCFMYLGLIVEMVVIGLFSGKVVTGLLVAYYLGEFFLMAGDFVMGASGVVIGVTAAEIREWAPSELPPFQSHVKLQWIPGENTVLDKLSKHGAPMSSTGSNFCPALTHYDLMMLRELRVPPPKAEALDRVAGENTIDDVGVFSEVWYAGPDVAERIDLTTGESRDKRSARRHRRSAWLGRSLSSVSRTMDGGD